jgi:hypothetical protein
LLGQYYRKHEFGLRFALFFVCALASNAVSSVSKDEVFEEQLADFRSSLPMRLAIWMVSEGLRPGDGEIISIPVSLHTKTF